MAPSYGGKLRLPSQNPIANLIETKAGHTWAESPGPGSFPRGDGRRRAPGTGAAPSPPPSRGRAGAPGTRPNTAGGMRGGGGSAGAVPNRAEPGWAGSGTAGSPGPAPLGTLRRRKKKKRRRGLSPFTRRFGGCGKDAWLKGSSAVWTPTRSISF